MEEIIIINGQDVESVRTLKSRYDNDSVEIKTGFETYRMKVNEILKLFNDRVRMKISKKKVHKYLEVTWCGD